MKPFLLSIAIALFGVTHPVYADVPERFAGDISIKAVSASAGNIGGSSRLELSIGNDSSTGYQFLGVESPIAPVTSLMGRVNEARATALDSMPILPDETLDFNTSHLWITLEPLQKPLIAGEQFLITLRFVRGDVSITAHVHP
jgi:copper(I)-binding protein